jgi:chromate reductase
MIEAQVLYGKAAAISGITPGAFGTALAQDHLTTLISFLNMRVMNAPRPNDRELHAANRCKTAAGARRKRALLKKLGRRVFELHITRMPQ